MLCPAFCISRPTPFVVSHPARITCKTINKHKFSYASATLKPWHDHYVQHNYDQVDHSLEAVYDTTLPTFWNVKDQILAATTPREKQMREDSLAFGVVKGFSIPIHGPREDFAILIASQRAKESWIDQHPERKYELMLLGHCYYAAVRRLLLKEAVTGKNQYNLSARELQCLTLMAQQYSVSQIASKLFITERTVQFHIQKINKKLGTHSKYQSIQKALQKGLITG